MVPAIGDGVGRGMGADVGFPRAAVGLSVREPAHVYVTSSELELLVRLRTASKVSNVNGSDALTSMAVVEHADTSPASKLSSIDTKYISVAETSPWVVCVGAGVSRATGVAVGARAGVAVGGLFSETAEGPGVGKKGTVGRTVGADRVAAGGCVE